LTFDRAGDTVKPRILPSARKHGLPDRSILHAVSIAFRVVRIEGEMVLIIGPDENGQLLEVIVADPDDDARIIHAMPLRRRFVHYLR
jgi:hypothetical protein